MKRAYPLTAAALALALSGCGGSSTTTDSGVAEFRVVHAARNVDAVNVNFRGAPFADNLSFFDAFPAAGQPAQITESGSGTLEFLSAADSSVISSSTVSQADGAIATAFLVGISGNTGTDALRTIVVAETRASMSSGQANIRFVHASPLLDTVDVYVTDPSVSLTGLSPTLNDVPRYGFGGLVSLDPGTYRIRVTGSDNQTVSLDNTETVSADTYNTLVMQPNGANDRSLLNVISSNL